MDNVTKTEKFFVGICDVDIHIENCHSLKERRKIVSSLKEKVKNRFNVSICEFGNLSLWQRSQLAIVTCSNTKNVVETTLKEAVDFINNFPSVIVLNSQSSIL